MEVEFECNNFGLCDTAHLDGQVDNHPRSQPITRPGWLVGSSLWRGGTFGKADLDLLKVERSSEVQVIRVYDETLRFGEFHAIHNRGQRRTELLVLSHSYSTKATTIHSIYMTHIPEEGSAPSNASGSRNGYTQGHIKQQVSCKSLNVYPLLNAEPDGDINLRFRLSHLDSVEVDALSIRSSK